jgi:hypothetical protein
LIAGPVDLRSATLGNDELNDRFSQNEHLVAENLLTVPRQRVSLRELIEFNEQPDRPEPIIRVPTQVRLVDPRDDTGPETRFALQRERLSVVQVSPTFVLKPILAFTKPDKQAKTSPAAVFDDVLFIAEQGDSAALEQFLAALELDRELAAGQLRRIAGLHRDAVQNAVDIVQTKRIDFLENPQEAGVEGSIMAFIADNVADVILEAILLSVFQLVAVGALAILGRARLGGRQRSLSAGILQRRQTIRGLTQELAALRRKGTTISVRNRQARASHQRLVNLVKARKAVLEAEITADELKKTLLPETFVEDAIERAQQLREKPGTILTKGKDFAKEKGKDELKSLASPSQTKADTTPRPSAIPLDVAMKLEVQDYFDPWLAAADDIIAFLKQTRVTFAATGDLPENAIDEVMALAEMSGALDDVIQEIASGVAGLRDVRADLTAFYELMLWLVMYRPRLSKVPLAPSKGTSDPIGGVVPGPLKPKLPSGDKGTMNLLRYLALRFFNVGTVTGHGSETKLTFSEDELLKVYLELEALCGRVFGATPTKEPAAVGPNHAGPAATKSTRLLVVEYEKPNLRDAITDILSELSD